MWTYPRVLAHRGGGVLAPENTMAALRKGFAMGFRGVEFDVMATRDDELVLIHDDVLGRTVAGNGSIGQLNLSDLLAMDAGKCDSRANKIASADEVRSILFCSVSKGTGSVFHPRVLEYEKSVLIRAHTVPTQTQ